MPLDKSSYSGPGGGSPHKVMLVLADEIYQNLYSKPSLATSLTQTWISAAALHISSGRERQRQRDGKNKRNLRISEIFVTSAREVFDGHLTRYRGDVVMFGIHGPLLNEAFQELPNFSQYMVGKNVIAMSVENNLHTVRTRQDGYHYFPPLLETMVARHEPLEILSALAGDALYEATLAPQELSPHQTLVVRTNEAPVLRIERLDHN